MADALFFYSCVLQVIFGPAQPRYSRRHAASPSGGGCNWCMTRFRFVSLIKKAPKVLPAPPLLKRLQVSVAFENFLDLCLNGWNHWEMPTPNIWIFDVVFKQLFPEAGLPSSADCPPQLPVVSGGFWWSSTGAAPEVSSHKACSSFVCNGKALVMGGF